MSIFLITNNKYKENEIKKIFNQYGINLKTFNDYNEIINYVNNKGLLEYIVIREKTKLLKNSEKISYNQLKNLDKVLHDSLLVVHYYENGIIIKQDKYENKVEGFIDFSRKTNEKNVYNWDDIFVEMETMKSYNEMKNLTNKFSARTKTISSFINDYIKLEYKVDLKFNPINQKEVLSFDGEINTFIDNNKYLNKYKNNTILKGLINNVKNQGLFTKSSSNKNQRNYWYPSLNAGLPLTPKKDELHEVTFMFHDLMHHVIPDLIISGNQSQSEKEAYVIHRMLSESITIVLADMLFIDELVLSKVKYDWNKRKIYPIYREFKRKGTSIERIKELIFANVKFALLGDDSELIKLSNEEVVKEYKEKYEKFFIEDYRWTIKNYENMNISKAAMKNWYQEIEELIPEDRKIIKFSNLLLNLNSYEDKVKVIFEEVWSSIERKIETELKPEKSIKNAFNNYMLGQLLIFFKYETNETSKIFFKLILDELKSNDSLTIDDIKRIRSFYRIYLEKLNKRNIISDEELINYYEIFPLFETFYVFYERELEYNSVKDIIKTI